MHCFAVVQVILASALQHPGSKSLIYLHSEGTTNRTKPVTHWLVADLSSPAGRALAIEGLGFILDEDLDPSASRLALLPAPLSRQLTALDVVVYRTAQVTCCVLSRAFIDGLIFGWNGCSIFLY